MASNSHEKLEIPNARLRPPPKSNSKAPNNSLWRKNRPPASTPQLECPIPQCRFQMTFLNSPHQHALTLISQYSVCLHMQLEIA